QLPQGVIHADLFPDNVFFLGTKLSGLIDFYFACSDTLFYDVAVCLNAWCFEVDHSYNVTKGRALLNAYNRGRALSGAERSALPILARGAARSFFSTTRAVPRCRFARGAPPYDFFSHGWLIGSRCPTAHWCGRRIRSSITANCAS